MIFMKDVFRTGAWKMLVELTLRALQMSRCNALRLLHHAYCTTF